ncbi:MAG TPA: hypothetical protein VJ505_14760 [Holophagaceae bacterium]|nr:hypothetical protein [Geothrix sp.]HJW34604.1 hypothetical protein [Holophagaceae bacterium]
MSPCSRVIRPLIAIVSFLLAGLAWAQPVPAVVQVNGIEQLYAAVNDPANAGATLVLAPGIYMLSRTDSTGLARPNGGRLELQVDMSLTGLVGDRSAVVIDAFDLPRSSFPAASVPNAAVRTGKGRNAVEWLTVRNTQNGQANIDTGLQPLLPGTAFVRIAHVASTGSARGLNALNFGPAASGETLEIDIIDCDFFNNPFGVSEGVRVGNFVGATGSTVNARMIGNRSWGNQQGRLIVNNRALRSTVNVFSSGNRFYANGAGTILIGGLSSDATVANGNTIHFEAHGDHFVDNTAPTILDVGGLVILGGENISIPNGTNDNTVFASLWGCRMGDNNTHDLAAWGARSVPVSIGLPGVNNHVTIEIHGDGGQNGKWQPIEFFLDGEPDGPNANNTVVVFRKP